MYNHEPQPCPPLSILQVGGADATAVLNNLTTNAVAALPGGGDGPPAACETFVTDIRGRALGHVVAIWTGYHWWLLGAAGQSQAIAGHIDRYTIREDVEVQVHDADRFGSIGWGDRSAIPPADKTRPVGYRVLWDRVSDCGELDVPWWGRSPGGKLATVTLHRDVPLTATGNFHQNRIAAGFPWYGEDLDDKNLPQEAGRDAEAINFHKGCYLGQETIARLDALGQVQKRLVAVRLVAGRAAGQAPVVGDLAYPAAAPGGHAAAQTDVKAVMRLTSLASAAVADDVGQTTFPGLAIARRSHFDAGSTASTPAGWTATVVPIAAPAPR